MILNEEKEESQRMKATRILQGAFEYNKNLRMLLKQPLEELVDLLKSVVAERRMRRISSPKPGRWSFCCSSSTTSVRRSE